MAPNTPPPSGQRIGRYELEHYLGGGMSAVYRARDTLINRPVALKLLKETFRPDDPMAQRFMLEAQIAGNLTHENVIRTYDFGFDPDGRPYMVLEFLEGQDLAQTMKTGTAGDLANRARIAWELAGALEYIHPRSVIHRDLKPANVLLAAPHGTVKLMDFGISRTEGIALTQTGMTVGTPGYMAPEQVRGENPTPSVDIYSYGVLLWELFANKRGFVGDTLERVFYMVLNDPLDLAPLRAAGVPEELVRLIGACTAKTPAERPPDLRGIRGELKRLMEGRAVAVEGATLAMPLRERAPERAPERVVEPLPKPVENVRAPNQRMMWGAIGVGLVLVAGLVWWMNVDSKKPDPPKAETPKAIPTRVLAERLLDVNGNMVLVKEGEFLAGEKKTVESLPAFYIDETEVSNEAYAGFAKATNSALPRGFAKDHPNWPVVNVSWDDAAKFAKWAGKRLPTSKEWEKAARGTDGRTYPWGNEAGVGAPNTGFSDRKRKGRMESVFTRDAAMSPYGARHMVGNAWEWTADEARLTDEERTEFLRTFKLAPGARIMEVKGGSHFEALHPKVLWDRAFLPSDKGEALVGFRCARDAP